MCALETVQIPNPSKLIDHNDQMGAGREPQNRCLHVAVSGLVVKVQLKFYGGTTACNFFYSMMVAMHPHDACPRLSDPVLLPRQLHIRVARTIGADKH